jgi:hypothetical protein
VKGVPHGWQFGAPFVPEAKESIARDRTLRNKARRLKTAAMRKGRFQIAPP